MRKRRTAPSRVARDVAVNLAELIGTLITRSPQDQHGIAWVAIPGDRPTPKPPVEVIRMLAGRSAWQRNLAWKTPAPGCGCWLELAAFSQLGLAVLPFRIVLRNHIASSSDTRSSSLNR
jgi:hypothetical protein